MSKFVNMLNLTVGAGNSVSLPQGFIWASINPLSGATFTITNSLPAIDGVNTPTSGPISVPISTGNCPNADGWDSHTISAIGGAVEILYCTGN